MPIGLISNFISCNLFSLENPYKTQAIELFGKDLAESLRNKNHSWKKVMTSWNILYEACIVIKDSNEYFSIIPKQLNSSLRQ